MISIDEMKNFTRSLPASTNFLQHSICEGGKKSPRQNIVQFFHCCAVRKWPVLIETGSHSSPDGIIVLSLASTFNNASSERTLKPIHKSLANAWLFQEIDGTLCLAFLFCAFGFVTLFICHIKGMINDLLWLVLEFTEACTGIIIRFANFFLL